MNVLGIETSCDETACAVVRDGRDVLSNVVYTQIKLHQPWGGVVPEIASRAHVEKIYGVVKQAMDEAGPGCRIDAVAVTYGPGLSPALLVGLNAAKGLAMSLGAPLIGVNHMEAHLHTPFLRDASFPAPDVPDPETLAPMLGLAVSGGHTCWVDVLRYGRYRIVGQTLDDAAGEAFDKAAKLLGLGYPGGPAVDRAAKQFAGGDFIPFPKGRPKAGTAALAGLDAELCTSFSGLKTALLHHVRQAFGEGPVPEAEIPRICASYQRAIVGVLADRTATALKRRNYRALVVGGGVSLNGALRDALGAVARRAGVPLLLAAPKFCGDNAAMIAGMAHYRRNLEGEAAFEVDVHPSLEAGDEP